MPATIDDPAILDEIKEFHKLFNEGFKKTLVQVLTYY